MESIIQLTAHRGIGRPIGPALPFIGALVALAGVVLPWATIYRGSQVLNGFATDGNFLAGASIGIIGLWTVYLAWDRPGQLRTLVIAAAALTSGAAAFDAWRIASYVAAPGPAGALVQPVAGPGPLVTLGGAAIVGVGAFLDRAGPRSLRGEAWPWLGLAALLGVAGWMHLALTGEHLQQSTMLGLGFAVSGILQIGLAGIVVWRPSRTALYAIATLNAVLIFLYMVNVVIGLPIVGGADEHVGPVTGLVLGRGEPVDLAGALTKLVELLGIVVAVVLVGREPLPSTMTAAAGSECGKDQAA